MTKIKDTVLVFLSSSLLILTFPKFDISSFAWMAFVPFFYVLINKGPVKAFFAGWTCGTLFFLGTIYWIINTMINYGHISVAVSLMILLVFSVYLGLFFGLFAYIVSYIEIKLSLLAWVLAPFVWVCTELLRTHLFTGFPWVLLGYSQYRSLNLIQVADVTGVYGISFIIVAVNSCIFLILSKMKFKKRSVGDFFSSDKIVISYLILVVLMLICFFNYGKKQIEEFYYHSSTTEKTIKNKLVIAVIQGNIEQDKKWDRNYQEETIKRYQKLTDKAIKGGNVDLVIWPETATPFYLQSEGIYLDYLLNYLREKKVYLLTGSPAYDNTQKYETESFNSAFLLSPDFKILKRYDKIHLVPFGEFIPFERILKINLFRDIIGDIGSFTSGREETVFSFSKGKFGTVICFEIIFPELVRRFIKKGGEFMVTITNDALFGKSAAPYQHFAMTVFRAVENKVYIARAANTGISGFINPVGEIICSSGVFVEGYLKNDIYLMENKTIYTLYGDIFAWICVLVLAASVIVVKMKKKDCFL